MRAVVLVGGEGTRLRPLTFTIPKQMLPVVEVPMIERVLGHLAQHGVTEAVLSLGYRPDAFLALFEQGRLGDMAVRCVVEPMPMGTGGAIRYAARSAGIDDTFLALNGDNLTDVDITALVAFHRMRSAEGTLELHRVEDATPFGLVSTAPDGRVEAFVEKPRPGEPGFTGGGNINAGVYVFEPSVLDRVPDTQPASIEREVFPFMAADGTLFATITHRYWATTDTPALYLHTQFDLLDGVRPPPPAPGAVLRDGPDDGVWLLGEPVIDGYVSGPSVVGTAAYVHAGARVERSVIGAGARLAEGVQVRNSVIMAGASIHAGAHVEGSIVGEEAIVGERAQLSDLTVVGCRFEVDPDVHLAGARLPVA